MLVFLLVGFVAARAAPDANITINVDPASGRAPISPYIYGVNQDLPGVAATARRRALEDLQMQGRPSQHQFGQRLWAVPGKVIQRALRPVDCTPAPAPAGSEQRRVTLQMLQDQTQHLVGS